MLKQTTMEDKRDNMNMRIQTGINCDADLRQTLIHGICLEEKKPPFIMWMTIEECLMNYNMKEWEV